MPVVVLASPLCTMLAAVLYFVAGLATALAAWGVCVGALALLIVAIAHRSGPATASPHESDAALA